MTHRETGVIWLRRASGTDAACGCVHNPPCRALDLNEIVIVSRHEIARDDIRTLSYFFSKAASVLVLSIQCYIDKYGHHNADLVARCLLSNRERCRLSPDVEPPRACRWREPDSFSEHHLADLSVLRSSRKIFRSIESIFRSTALILFAQKYSKNVTLYAYFVVLSVIVGVF